jgi:hypothetical protein
MTKEIDNMNTYVVEGGVGKCTAFSALIPELKKKSEVQIYTPYIGCFANNPDVKLVLEQSFLFKTQELWHQITSIILNLTNLIFNLANNTLLKAIVICMM